MRAAWLPLATLVVVASLMPAAEKARAETPLSDTRRGDCEFQLGFATLREQLGEELVGECIADELHNPATGDGFQITTNGLLLWRKWDNLAAFWDGQQAWSMEEGVPSAMATDLGRLIASANSQTADPATSPASAVWVPENPGLPLDQSDIKRGTQTPPAPTVTASIRQPPVATAQSGRVFATSKNPANNTNQPSTMPHVDTVATTRSAAPPHSRAALICSPRPPVSVQTTYGDPGTLVVTVSTAAPPLVALRFEEGANASVEIPPTAPHALPFAQTLSSETATTSFLIHQLSAGTAATISKLVIVDGCGDWPTFVGGGSNAYSVTYRTYGLNFSPYIGQDPNKDPSLTALQVQVPLSRIAPYTTWVRSFSCTSGLSALGLFAHMSGLKSAVGAWIGPSETGNQEQLACLISAVQNGQVDLAIVGSEVLLRKDRTEAQLLAYINQVKQAAHNVPVTTADVYSVLLEHPNVIVAVDVQFVNYYPYWEGTRIDRAIAALNNHHLDMLAAAGGKQVYVSETGWPSCGNTVGQAVPSTENASMYFQNFVSWAQATHTPFFYFEALDEPWKVAYEGPQGACWGIFGTDMKLKSGVAPVFHGQTTIADNWTLIGGPGMPTLNFTSVPTYGTFDPLLGDVWHVSPRDYQVVVYIQVGGAWWIKPTAASPVTPLGADGRWITRITTGGSDQNATHITAYLVRKGYSPPILLGASSLPAELDKNAVARADALRAPPGSGTHQP